MHFRPEFINRIDEFIIFQGLRREQIKSIVALQVGAAVAAAGPPLGAGPGLPRAPAGVDGAGAALASRALPCRAAAARDRCAARAPSCLPPSLPARRRPSAWRGGWRTRR